MSTFPALAYISNAARTEGEVKQALEDIIAAAKQIVGAGIADQALTIASGDVTPAGGASGILKIDTEGAAATDDLDHIIQTNVPDGSCVLVHNTNAARVVAVQHSAGGGGQIVLQTGGDFVLADPLNHWLLLKRDGTTWQEIWRSPSAVVPEVLTKTGAYTTTVADRNKLIDGTANTWTLTLLAAATAGKGFLQPVKNSGTGVITIDGNGAEPIDGAATLKLNPGDEIILICDGSGWKSFGRFLKGAVVPAGHLWGATLSNNGVDATNDIDIAAGECASNEAAAADRVLLVLPALTKRLDATWVTGTNQGGRSSSQAIADGTWHVFAIKVAGVDDVGFDTSVTGANLIADHAATHVRILASILREAGAIVVFSQEGDEFLRSAGVLDVDVTNPGTAAVDATLSVPAGLKVWAILNAVEIGTTNSQLNLSAKDQSDQATSTTAAPLFMTQAYNIGSAAFGSGRSIVRTNTSRQVRYRASVSGGDTVVRIATLGWIHPRGRHA